MAIRIEWGVAYAAGKKCHDLAGELSLAFGPLHSTLVHNCKGMAGDAPGCLQWAQEYDTAAADFTRAAAALVNALAHYGDVLYAYGWNYAVSQRPTNMPEKPVESSLYYDTEMDMPAATGANGLGAEQRDGDSDLYNRFVDKIRDELGALPNGDTDRLAAAASAWKTFNGNAAVTGAADSVGTVIALFETLSDPNKDTLLAQLGSLRQGATDLASAGLSIGTAVEDYSTGTSEVRSAISTILSTAIIGVTVTAVVGVIAACFTFGGGGAAAAGGIGAIITNTLNACRTAYEGSKLIRIIGLLGRLGPNAVGVVTAFNTAKNIQTLTGTLATILAIKVAIDSMDEGENAGGGGSEAGAAVPNKAVTDEMARMLAEGIDDGLDCSEIAARFEKLAGGEGEMLKVLPPAGEQLRLKEFGVWENFDYHQIFTDGKYVYDPRVDPNPIPIDVWRNGILGDNPKATIEKTEY
ncbi:hypothetical protein ABZ319_16945 [Nocardia sp. NPDC005978]|uniref:hypothetical protein n=1 Tax=Nocardia sp. NPDC005978 TaxID=3156725 RepID=UPI0033BBAE64